MAWKPENLDEFVADVEGILTKRGHTPGIVDDRVHKAAAELLSAFKVCPTLSPAAALHLDGGADYSARMHGD
uniref:hypothetical protein n=1 Tax=Amycolatopsis sp. CA-096443 TaxID=3239919 RepID=UPI003F49A1ED